jgi:hypothetical protein
MNSVVGPPGTFPNASFVQQVTAGIIISATDLQVLIHPPQAVLLVRKDACLILGEVVRKHNYGFRGFPQSFMTNVHKAA